MKVYFRFILAVIYLSQSIKASPVSTVGRQSDILDSNGLLNVSEKQLRMYTELLYIVVVVSEIGSDSMRAYRKRICTGTMIRNDLVMTLASCLLAEYHELPDAKDTKVFERDSNGLSALKIFINPNYYSKDRYESKANDFGLIVVKKSKQTVFPRLPESLVNFRDIINNCLLAGYGYSGGVLDSNFRIFDINRTTVEIFNGPACNTGTRICLNLLKIMPCKEDQGSPIICNGVLYALYTPRYNSFSARCVDVYITTFAPVYNVLDWVKQRMDNPTSNFEWLNEPLYVILLCVTVFTLMGAIYYVLVEVLLRRLDPTEDQTAPKSNEEDDGESYGSYESSI